MPRLLTLLALFFAAPFAQAAGEGAAAAADAPAKSVVVLELFTSQGCYSCPPAEDLLKDDYARRDGVLALELHVDYWDDLIYGLAGSWEDPFSQNAFTRRQGAYNRRIRGTGSMFTPQVIIHGAASASGTQKHRIDLAILKASSPRGIEWRFAGDAKTGWQANVKGALEPGAELVYAIFLRTATTKIPSGENKGKTLTNTNIVTELRTLSLDAASRRLQLPVLKPGEDCAVWAQSGGGGRILSAARCPS